MIPHWQKSGQLSPISPPQKIYKNNKFYKFLPLKKMAFFFPNLLWWFSHEQNWGEKLLERQLLELSWVSGKNWAWAPVGENRGDESRIPNLFCPREEMAGFFQRLVFRPPRFFWERATMGGWFLKENKHKTLRFTVFYAPEGSETLVKR